jgi:hypothetical protein
MNKLTKGDIVEARFSKQGQGNEGILISQGQYYEISKADEDTVTIVDANGNDVVLPRSEKKLKLVMTPEYPIVKKLQGFDLVVEFTGFKTGTVIVPLSSGSQLQTGAVHSDFKEFTAETWEDYK